MRLHTLVCFPQHHKPSLRPITSSASETTQNECALPLSPMPLPEGDKADTSQSPERHSREPLCQGICVSLIMTQFQRRSCLSCHSHAGLLISSSSSPSLFALLCFSEILIKRKDRHDECEVAPLTTEGNEQCV